uniref:Uncharacterized protein n=1 Tax=Ascaris lumbricoides TaxID=6252 RepID=A0A0M3I6U1_ASCLU
MCSQAHPGPTLNESLWKFIGGIYTIERKRILIRAVATKIVSIGETIVSTAMQASRPSESSRLI